MPGLGTSLKKLEIMNKDKKSYIGIIEQENLYKVGGSIKRLKSAENMLWQGKTDEVINLFKDFKGQAFKTFGNYLETHRCRIVNYQYYKEDSISSIGLGTVESTIKRIGLRVKISGAQWNIENVS